MQACPRCAAALPEGKATCTACGYSLGYVAAPSAPQLQPVATQHNAPDPFAYTGQAAPPPPPPPPLPGYPPAYPPGYPPAYSYASGYPQNPWAAQRKTNPLAITSLVCACLPFLVVTPIAAVVCGHIARKQIRERGEGGEGIALGGLIVGYIFGALIALAIVIPIFLNGHSGLYGNRAPCACIAADNLRNMATAEETQLIDHGYYTSSMSDLEYEGFQPVVDTTTKEAMVAAGSESSIGYCLVAGASTVNQWYLYDSRAGGLSSLTFASEDLAKSACSMPVSYGSNLDVTLP